MTKNCNVNAVQLFCQSHSQNSPQWTGSTVYIFDGGIVALSSDPLEAGGFAKIC